MAKKRGIEVVGVDVNEHAVALISQGKVHFIEPDLVMTKDGRAIQTSTLLPHQGKALCDVAGIGAITVSGASGWTDPLVLGAVRGTTDAELHLGGPLTVVGDLTPLRGPSFDETRAWVEQRPGEEVRQQASARVVALE